jgi:hypothetical protein
MRHADFSAQDFTPVDGRKYFRYIDTITSAIRRLIIDIEMFAQPQRRSWRRAFYFLLGGHESEERVT